MEFDSFPLEIKVHILSYLTPIELRRKCALICKEWRTLSVSPYLKSHVEIDMLVLSRDEMVQRLMTHNRARVVKFVNVTDWHFWLYLTELPEPLERKSVHRLEFVNCFIAESVGICFPNIREVKTARCYPQDYGRALHLALVCPNLEVVQLDEATSPPGTRSYSTSIDHCKDNLKKLCVNSLVLKTIIIESCKNLTHLELYGAQEMTKEILMRLKSLGQLHTLRITYGVYLSDNAFTCLFTPNTFPHLSSLNLDTCLELSDSGVEAIAMGCPLLKKLQLSNCHRITDHGVEAISKNCRHLEDLNLSGCYSVRGVFLSTVTFYLHSLAYLNLQACYQIPEFRIESLLAEKSQIRLIRTSVSRT